MISCSSTIEYTLLPPKASCYLIFKLNICLKLRWPREVGEHLKILYIYSLFLWGINFIRLFFSASQLPLGKTGHLTFSKIFSYIMQCYIVLLAVEDRFIETIPISFSSKPLPLYDFKCFLQYLTFIAFSIHYYC